jgi:hypothetical protein
MSLFKCVQYLGYWCASGRIAQLVELKNSIPRVRSDCQFSHPVTFGTQRGTMTEYSSVTLRNLGQNFNIVENMSWFRTVHYLWEKMCKRPYSSVGRAAEQYSDPGWSRCQAAHFTHPVTSRIDTIAFWIFRYSNSMKHLANKFMHLTNYSVNKKNADYQANADDTVCQGHKW